MSKNSNKKVAHGLVALSSAAVLAVYSAGYAKTQAAAQRFAAQDTRHHESVTRSVARNSGGAVGENAVSITEPSTTSPNEPQQIASLDLHTGDPRHSGALPDATTGTNQAPAAQAPAANNPVPGSATPATQANTPAPATAPASAAPSSQPAPVSVASVNPEPPANPAPPADAPPPPPGGPTVDYFGNNIPIIKANVVPGAKWKDGTYYAWGSCVHGDIQTAVVVQNGRIAATHISKCLTRYPCDMISDLPAMAVKRQSSGVDFVSGATESAEAFMEALGNALDKARNPDYLKTAPKK